MRAQHTHTVPVCVCAPPCAACECGHVFCVNLKLFNSKKEEEEKKTKLHTTTTQKNEKSECETFSSFFLVPAAHSGTKAIVFESPVKARLMSFCSGVFFSLNIKHDRFACWFDRTSFFGLVTKKFIQGC